MHNCTVHTVNQNLWAIFVDYELYTKGYSKKGENILMLNAADPPPSLHAILPPTSPAETILETKLLKKSIFVNLFLQYFITLMKTEN